MKKIKEFFKKIFYQIGKGLGKVFRPIAKFLKMILSPIGKLLGKIFAPLNRLFGKIKYEKRQAIWGIVFVLPLLIGFIYFFLIPFCTTIVYSFSNVKNLAYNDETKQFLGVVTEWVGFETTSLMFLGDGQGFCNFPFSL